jgi:hypothetical protein
VNCAGFRVPGDIHKRKAPCLFGVSPILPIPTSTGSPRLPSSLSTDSPARVVCTLASPSPPEAPSAVRSGVGVGVESAVQVTCLLSCLDVEDTGPPVEVISPCRPLGTQARGWLVVLHVSSSTVHTWPGHQSQPLEGGEALL